MGNSATSGLACDYCGNPAKLMRGVDIYPHRPDLQQKRFWACVQCQAWVGCHPGTSVPLGRLANSHLRIAKMRAHAAFDPLWRSGRMTRRAAYAWLAGELGITVDEAHIGRFDVETCDRVVAIVERRNGAEDSATPSG